jgi:glutamate 5-kinase
MLIAHGHERNPLRRVWDGGRCTWFLPDKTPVTGWKVWISGSVETRGALSVDDGAVKALRGGKSLLPAGVRGVKGRFQRGDTVAILGPGGEEIGRGLVAYDATDAERIAGRKSAEIAEILGYAGRTEMIHRDDMALRGE